MAGRWKVKHPDMRPLAVAAQRLAPFGTVWTWVPREQNKHADRLANLAMDAAARGEMYTARRVDGAARAYGAERRAGDPDASAARLARPRRATPTKLILLRHGETQHTADQVLRSGGSRRSRG